MSTLKTELEQVGKQYLAEKRIRTKHEERVTVLKEELKEVKKQLKAAEGCLGEMKISNEELERRREIASKEIHSLTSKLTRIRSTNTSFSHSITHPEDSDRLTDGGADMMIFQ